jgi:formylglycine-generating enzyme required for sulfatase activity
MDCHTVARALSAAAVLLALALTGCLEKVDSVPVAPGPSAAALTEVTTPQGVLMVAIPGGRFHMGSAGGAANEQPEHEVELSPFVIDKYEVTQDQYAQLQLPNPAHFKGPRRPVEQVRWSDAALFCNERSRADGLEPCYDEVTFACNFAASGYRLPTEAEWEYAARAGSQQVAAASGEAVPLDARACYAGNSSAQTQPAGSRRANAWGLHDLQGNVAEWCNDVYAEDYYARSATVDPRGPVEGEKRVLRGGSWKSTEDECRVTARAADDPGISDACFARDTYGFRCVRRPNAQEAQQLATP